ncbi:MAG: transposase [Kiritimatiellae bacterium]|nr:transposase [Kiritimatiellia bacterium]
MKALPPTTRPHHRRYPGYDYSRGAAVFATIATEPRRPIFGQVRDGAMVLSECGHILEASIREAAPKIGGIALHAHVVMPDHAHLRFHANAGLGNPVATIGAFVGRIKQFSQWRIARSGGPDHVWQRGYHDHLCLSRQMIDAVDRYIANNPLKWWLMHGDKSLLHVREPLAAEWLPSDAFWRGVGAIAPDPGRPLVALRISRNIPAEKIPAVVEDCVKGAEIGGYVYVSTFFSPGERAVFRAVAERTSAPMIHLRHDAIAWAYRPKGMEPGLFASRRLLAIARMEATDAPADRASLLWLNAKACEIAAAAWGKAVYARYEGGKVVWSATPQGGCYRTLWIATPQGGCYRTPGIATPQGGCYRTP